VNAFCQEQKMIDLSQPRAVALNAGGRVITYTIRRLTQQDWMTYFAGAISTSEQRDNEVLNQFDGSKAALELVGGALIQKEGDRPAPVSHRLAVANALMSVRAVDPGDDELAAGAGNEVVSMIALWGAEDGVMKRHAVTHVFDSPSIEQARRYRRDLSRSKVVGGSRAGKTIWANAQPTLAEIYDELIVCTVGYFVNSTALAARERIAREMDTYHKVVACEKLFAPAEIAVDLATGD
jgi:hypothetical protein